MLLKILGKNSSVGATIFQTVVSVSIALTLSLEVYRVPASLGQGVPATTFKTFADWCSNQANLSAEVKHTVEVLLKEAGTSDCDAANKQLSRQTILILKGYQISNLSPLQSLTNLTMGE